VDEDACFYIHVVVFVIPVGLKSDWHTIPPVWIYVSEAVTDHANYASRKNVRLLVQMHVVLVGVIKSGRLKSKQGCSTHGRKFLKLTEA
jgi:hypothetical protein